MARTDDQVNAVWAVLYQQRHRIDVAKQYGVNRKTIARWCNSPRLLALVEQRRVRENEGAPEPVAPVITPEPTPKPKPKPKPKREAPAAPVLKLAPADGLLSPHVKRDLIDGIQQGLVMRLALKRCRLGKDAIERWEELAKKGDKRAQALLLDIGQAEGECAMQLIREARAGGGGGKNCLHLLGRLHRKEYGEAVPDEGPRDDSMEQYDDEHLKTVAEAG